MSDTEQADSGAAVPVQVILGDDPIVKGKAWDDWLEEIERKLRYFKITEPLDKKDALIIYGGKEIARLEKSLPNRIDDANDYEKLSKKLSDYFKPKKNQHHARYVFLEVRPTHDKTASVYAALSRKKANECEFEANFNENILEYPIQLKQHNQSLIKKSHQQEMVFDMTVFNRSC